MTAQTRPNHQHQTAHQAKPDARNEHTNLSFHYGTIGIQAVAALHRVADQFGMLFFVFGHDPWGWCSGPCRHVRYRAANEKGGTSADVFAGFPKQYTVYGKTGTAERGVNPDQAWYACFVPDKARPIVVIVTVEKGGFGAETAAPAARLILSQWFDTGDRSFHAGSSTTL